MPVNDIKWFENISEFDESCMKSCTKESDEGYFLEVDIQYLELLHNLHNNLPFLPEKMTSEKVGELLANLQYKTEYVIHIRNLKQALNHRLVLKKGT